MTTFHTAPRSHRKSIVRSPFDDIREVAMAGQDRPYTRYATAFINFDAAAISLGTGCGNIRAPEASACSA